VKSGGERRVASGEKTKSGSVTAGSAADDRVRGCKRLRDPLHGEFLALLGAVEKIKIDQLLVREAGFIGQAFEIVHNPRTQVDSHSLFLGGVGVLEFLQFGKIIGFLHKI
jgi:hypothetical protein